jgi:sec-independent protein translocase protein TatA
MLVLGIVIVIFGAGRISELGGALGKSIREFRRSTEAPTPEPVAPEPAALTPAAILPPASRGAATVCPSCNTDLPAGQPFCGHCGAAIPARTPPA